MSLKKYDAIVIGSGMGGIDRCRPSCEEEG